MTAQVSSSPTPEVAPLPDTILAQARNHETGDWREHQRGTDIDSLLPVHPVTDRDAADQGIGQAHAHSGPWRSLMMWGLHKAFYLESQKQIAQMHSLAPVSHSRRGGWRQRLTSVSMEGW